MSMKIEYEWLTNRIMISSGNVKQIRASDTSRENGLITAAAGCNRRGFTATCTLNRGRDKRISLPG